MRNALKDHYGKAKVCKMTDDLSGLSAELRKAAQCMQTHYPADKKAHSGDCVYWLLYETAAVLVEKEMLGFKLWVQNELAKELNKEGNSLNRDELLLRLIDKVEELFG